MVDVLPPCVFDTLKSFVLFKNIFILLKSTNWWLLWLTINIVWIILNLGLSLPLHFIQMHLALFIQIYLHIFMLVLFHFSFFYLIIHFIRLFKWFCVSFWSCLTAILHYIWLSILNCFVVESATWSLLLTYFCFSFCRCW